MTLNENTPFVVLKLEEEVDDAGHAELVVHGDPEIVTDIAGILAVFLAAQADQIIRPGEDIEDGEDAGDIAGAV